eukprot:1020114-Prorocentrum_minimum.AAC.2
MDAVGCSSRSFATICASGTEIQLYTKPLSSHSYPALTEYIPDILRVVHNRRTPYCSHTYSVLFTTDLLRVVHRHTPFSLQTHYPVGRLPPPRGW